VVLLAGGGWSQMGLKGNVRLKEGDRLGLADLALFANIPETATLTGHASVRDSATETSATEITLVQTSGDFTATGGVHSADFSAKSSSVNLAPAPANITANSLTGNEKSGYALYSGHARFWQGANVLEADTILLQRDARVLTAKENVRAVFLQERPGIREGSARPKVPMLWHITAGKLTYWDKQDRAHLENNVILASPEERMRSDRLDLYFARAAGKEGSVAAGTQQISRAVAEGKVVVEQGVRRATAQRGEYTASEGKFVMSGGNPTIFDANSGTTTGSQLTFFLTDDTIVVDSKNGSRTVTKHRIEN
jgi:lipopolysaccharide export system protein LptA